MRGRRIVALATVVAAGLGVLTTAAGAQAEGGDPASDIGITAKQIRIAVVADVENSFRPGLFASSPAAVRGWAKYINKQGGIAGRKVVVDFIDSHLSPDESRSAVQQACEEDFALVGTAALFLTNVDDMVNCVDKAGAATGIPDLPIVTTEVAQQCSPVSYPINPAQLDCTTKDDPEQTWRANSGPIKFYEKSRFKELHGISIFANDIKAAATAGRVLAGGASASGVDPLEEEPLSSLATQTEYTPVVQQAKSDGANYMQVGSDYAMAVKLRREAKLQGISPESVVFDCFSNCYDEKLIDEGGADVEGQYATLNQLPFSESKENKALAAYMKNVPADDIDGFGAYAWISGFLFRDAVNAVVEQSGENGITRKAVLAALADTHEFDADGMWAPTDIGNRIPPSCFISTQVKDGKFVRVHPKKVGTFDCKKGNGIEFQANLLGG